MALTYNFVQLGAHGRLALSERPKLIELKELKQEGCDLVVTILAQHGEQARRIGNEVKAQGMDWEWVNIGHAQVTSDSERVTFRKSV